MLGFIADILTSIISVLLPVFFSYKALRTSDPAVLTPWLMYWTTLSLFLLVESQLNFILSWIPFYSWIRFGVHLYLVLPGQQGCVFLYKRHIHPFLEEHERQIDHMITDAHAKAKSAGLDAVKRAIEYVRVQVLGLEPKRPSPPPSRNMSYTAHLFNRFAMPAARDGLSSAGTSDVFSLIGRALQQTTYSGATSTGERGRDLTASGTLIPPSLTGEDRTVFVNTQRERLQTLIQAFDSEAHHSSASASTGVQPFSSRSIPMQSRKPYLSPQGGYIPRSKSESEFEDLAYEPMPNPDDYRSVHDHDQTPPAGQRLKEGAGWGNWIWGNYGERNSALNTKKDS